MIAATSNYDSYLQMEGTVKRMNVILSEILSGLLGIAFQNTFDKLKSGLVKKKEQEALNNKIQKWANDLMLKNESTVLSGDLFIRYLNNYNLFEHFLNTI